MEAVRWFDYLVLEQGLKEAHLCAGHGADGREDTGR